MKKLLLFLTIVLLFLISCGPSKKELRIAYNTNPTPDEKYDNDPNSLSKKAALAMIGEFKRHKYRGWRKHYVDSAWTYFTKDELAKFTKDDNIVSVKFFLAAQINPDDKETFKIPTIVVQLVTQDGNKARGSNFSGSVLYVSGTQYCPPPKGSCRVTP